MTSGLDFLEPGKVHLICKGLPMPRSTTVRPPNSLKLSRRAFSLAAAALLLPQAGCGFMSHVMYWARGNPVEEKFGGLKKKTVAVVCFDANVAGASSEADALAKSVGTKLAMNVNGITVVDHQKVLDWIDGQSGNVTDFRDIGRGVKADMVVGIELERFQTHDGPTLLRGRARTGVKVFDLTQGGKVVYAVPMNPVTYPENGPRPMSDNEDAFKAIFIDIVSKRIAKDFYAYDKLQDYGNDALFMGG